MNGFEQFEGQKYLAIETYRKNGIGVKTPVGFIHEGSTLLIRTLKDSGKAKRMRGNPNVLIAPSTARGEPTGAWQPAIATALPSAEAHQLRPLFIKRYGFAWRFFELVGLLSLRNRTSKEWSVFRLRVPDGT